MTSFAGLPERDTECTVIYVVYIFANLEKWTHCCRSGIFLEVQVQKIVRPRDLVALQM